MVNETLAAYVGHGMTIFNLEKSKANRKKKKKNKIVKKRKKEISTTMIQNKRNF